MTYEELQEAGEDIIADIESQMNSLKYIVANFDKNNLVWELLNPVIYVHFANLNTLLMDLGTIIQEMMKKKVPAVLILDSNWIDKSLYNSVFVVYKSLMETAKKTANDLASFDKPIKNGDVYFHKRNEVVAKLKSAKAYPMNEKLSEVKFEDVVEVYQDVCNKLNRASMIARRYFSSIKNMLRKMSWVEEDAYLPAIKELVMDMAREMEEDVMRELKCQVVTMKDKRSDKLTKEHWGMLLETEERAIAIAKDQLLAKSEDECMKCYSIEFKKEMDYFNDLMSDLSEIMVGDDLLDVGTILNKDFFYLGNLYSSNMDLFVKLLLRGNIMRKEMNDELKGEYEEWIRGKKLPDLGKQNSETINVQRREGVLSTEQAEAIWEKLRKKKIVDENNRPNGLSMAQSGVLASIIADRLGIDYPWKTFGDYWDTNKETLRKASYDGYKQAQMSKFIEKINDALR